MKKNNLSLTILWSLAILALLTGLLLSIRVVGNIGHTTENWRKKNSELQDMMAMRATASEYRALLRYYSQYPASPPQLSDLAHTAVPGVTLTTRLTDTHPATPGWTARKVNIGITDIAGDDLGRFLEAASGSTPPWALLDCTLSASPTPGRLAKVELVLETVERSVQ